MTPFFFPSPSNFPRSFTTKLKVDHGQAQFTTCPFLGPWLSAAPAHSTPTLQWDRAAAPPTVKQRSIHVTRTAAEVRLPSSGRVFHPPPRLCHSQPLPPSPFTAHVCGRAGAAMVCTAFRPPNGHGCPAPAHVAARDGASASSAVLDAGVGVAAPSAARPARLRPHVPLDTVHGPAVCPARADAGSVLARCGRSCCARAGVPHVGHWTTGGPCWGAWRICEMCASPGFLSRRGSQVVARVTGESEAGGNERGQGRA